MNTSALILMIGTQVTVTLITVYFFIRVLRTPPKVDVTEDSYSDNDPEPESEK